MMGIRGLGVGRGLNWTTNRKKTAFKEKPSLILIKTYFAEDVSPLPIASDKRSITFGLCFSSLTVGYS